MYAVPRLGVTDQTAVGALLGEPAGEGLIPELVSARGRVAGVADPPDIDLPRPVARGQDRVLRTAIKRPQPARRAGSVEDIVVVNEEQCL